MLVGTCTLTTAIVVGQFNFFTYSGLAKTNSFVMLAFTLIVFNSAKHICLLVTTSCFFFLFVFLMFVGTSLSYSCLCYI